jgi:hypothetical protein
MSVLQMDGEQVKLWLLVWGAGLSTALAVLKIWEVFWKDRERLKTSYNFSGQSGHTDEITVVNLSSAPVQVSYWTLAWEPRYPRLRGSISDLTPELGGYAFSIEPHAGHTIGFAGGDQFDWSSTAAAGRGLYVRLFGYDRRGPRRLLVMKP